MKKIALAVFLSCLHISPALAVCHKEDGKEVCTPAVHIVIDGIKGESYDNAFASLSLQRQKQHPRLNVRRIKTLFAKGEEQIQQALKPFGFYRAEVSSELQQKSCGALDKIKIKDCKDTYWEAKYRVKPGIPMLVRTVDIQILGAARDDTAFQTLVNDFPLKAGEPLKHPVYDKAKQDFLRLAQKRGYFNAEFKTSEIRIDTETYAADIVLRLNGGARHQFGTTRFEQDPPDTFAENFLRRFIDYNPGDNYHADDLLAIHNSLTDSDYFAEIAIEPDLDNISGSWVPVVARLKLRKPNKYTAGIGYGTDTGVRGSLGWERRYINRHGHRFGTELQASGGNTNLSNSSVKWSANYDVPVGHPNRKYLSFKTGYLNERTDQWETETAILSGIYHHPRTILGRALTEKIGIEYQYERFAFPDSERIETGLLMPVAEWLHVKAKDRMAPRRGYKVGLNLRGAAQGLGSDLSFFQSRLLGTWINSIGKRSRILTRGEVGYTWTDEFSDLPVSQRFFAGGDRSVRGYSYQSLGEINDRGEVIGGEYLLVGSLEYEFRFLEKWGVALFYDVGNAFSDFSEDLEHGAGIGMRWLSPIGMVRVDVATALSSDDDNPFRLHIVIGPDL
jgi:translocation and assembly module TamA